MPAVRRGHRNSIGVPVGRKHRHPLIWVNEAQTYGCRLHPKETFQASLPAIHMAGLCRRARSRLEFLRSPGLSSSEERTHAGPRPVHRICGAVPVPRVRASLPSPVTLPAAVSDRCPLLCDSYMRRVSQPSISYAARAHLWRAMKVSIRSHSADSAERSAPIAGDCPTPEEVLTDIGVVLGVHLALAVAVTVALRAFGIV